MLTNGKSWGAFANEFHKNPLRSGQIGVRLVEEKTRLDFTRAESEGLHRLQTAVENQSNTEIEPLAEALPFRPETGLDQTPPYLGLNPISCLILPTLSPHSNRDK